MTSDDKSEGKTFVFGGDGGGPDGVMQAVQEKLGGLVIKPGGDEVEEGDENEVEDESGAEEEVDVWFVVLRALEGHREQILSEYNVERKALERKYAARFGRVFADRAAVVGGRGAAGRSGTAPTDLDEITTTIQSFAANANPSDDVRSSVLSLCDAKVDGFWSVALGNHPAFGGEEGLISARDSFALAYLNDVRVCDVDEDEKVGFKLEFEFGENPYFSDKVLTKAYYIPNMYEDGADPILEASVCSGVSWKTPSSNLVEGRSFFSLFTFSFSGEDVDEGTGDEEYAERCEHAEEDFGAAEIIRQKIVPHAFAWYTGEALDELDDDDDDEGDIEEEEEEDYEEEDEYNEGEDINTAGTENPPDCKQQ